MPISTILPIGSLSMRDFHKSHSVVSRPAGRYARAALLSLSMLSAVQAAPLPAGAGGPTLTLQALRAAYSVPTGHITKIAGVDIYYTDEGSGPAILLCNGSSSSLRTWDGLVAALKGSYRIIRFDIPPGDLSGSIPPDLRAKLVPTDIPEGLLDQLHIKHVTGIGVSSGGTMVVQLAAKRPDLVERLILSNTPSDPVDTGPMVLSAALKRETDIFKETGYRSQAYWNAFWDFFAGVPGRIPAATRQLFYDMNRRAPEPDPLGMAAKVADHARSLQNFAAVHAPVLLVWGERDPLLTPPSEKVLANYLTNTQVSALLLPDVGHYPPIEVPVRFGQIVRDYIEIATPSPTSR
jgi:pimeloyl-ACP methyl ester carboxylesterase